MGAGTGTTTHHQQQWLDCDNDNNTVSEGCDEAAYGLLPSHSSKNMLKQAVRVIMQCMVGH
jgi:hypothetical protein